jgi:phosphopantothenate synthetase
VTIELRLTATGRVLDSLVGTNPAVVWNGNVAALVSESDLVVLDGTTVTKMPLP